MAGTAYDSLQRIRESVRCPICYQIFDKPTSLPCGHTFCRVCIRRASGQSSDRSERYYDDSDDDERPSYGARMMRRLYGVHSEYYIDDSDSDSDDDDRRPTQGARMVEGINGVIWIRDDDVSVPLT